MTPILRLTLLVLLLLPLTARAQDQMSPQTAPLPSYTQEQIDQMTAPIALYPDPLVAQILMASTYPLEIVEASRWLQIPQNAQLSSGALTAALTQQPWDPSVKSLVAFPQVLSMMNNNLQWTEQMGDAFLGNQAAVMDSVQRLRQMAQASGHLATTPQQYVASDAGAITIEPANPQIVFVPSYDPNLAYGAWPYPDYEPYYFPFPGVYLAGSIIGFGVGIAVDDWLWGWNRWDWHHHRIDIDDRRFSEMNRGHAPLSSGVFEHDPAHRHGVPYRSAATRSQFQGASDEARRSYRGYGQATPQARSAVAPQATSGARQGNFNHQVSPTFERTASPTFNREASPAITRQEAAAPMQPRAAPAFESFSRGTDVRAQSERGQYSRSTMPSIPSTPQRSAPAVSSGGGSRGGGGRNENVRTR